MERWCRAVRPGKVALYSGCDSCRVRTSHPPVASLGAMWATTRFKRRQAREWAESGKLKTLSHEIPNGKADAIA